MPTLEAKLKAAARRAAKENVYLEQVLAVVNDGVVRFEDGSTFDASRSRLHAAIRDTVHTILAVMSHHSHSGAGSVGPPGEIGKTAKFDAEAAHRLFRPLVDKVKDLARNETAFRPSDGPPVTAEERRGAIEAEWALANTRALLLSPELQGYRCLSVCHCDHLFFSWRDSQQYCTPACRATRRTTDRQTRGPRRYTHKSK